LRGDFEVCQDCAVAKARQKNLNKVWKDGSQFPGESPCIDISSIKRKALVVPSFGFFLLMITQIFVGVYF